MFEEWTVAHQTWWATVHEPKKNSGYREPVGDIFCGFTLYNRDDFVFKEPIGDALRSKSIPPTNYKILTCGTAPLLSS